MVFGGVVEMVVEEKELGRSWEESSPATWPEVKAGWALLEMERKKKK